MSKHILGIPRSGAQREQKKALGPFCEAQNILRTVWKMRQSHQTGWLSYPERFNLE